MTIYNDLCDFCGGYVDPIGGDLAEVLKDNQTLWCGVCNSDDEGRLLVDKELAMQMSDYDKQDQEDRRAALSAAADVLKHKSDISPVTIVGDQVLELANRFYEWL